MRLANALTQFAKTTHGVTRRCYGAGEYLFRQDDPSTTLACILSGHVRVFLLSPDGRERTIRLLGPNDLAGDGSFYLRSRHDGFAEAFEGPVETLELNRAAYHALLQERPDLCEELLKVLAHSTQLLTEAIERQTFQDLRERVQTILIGAAGRYGVVSPDGVVIEMHLTHETIASLVGATRSRVSVCLSALQREGFYRVVDQRIVLSPWAAGMILPP